MKRYLMLFVSCCLALAAQQPSPGPLTSGDALRLLKEGNERYRTSHLTHPHQSAERRIQVSAEQHPFAQVLACSDSRVPPEIIFDQGLGDIFVVRVAGNTVDDLVQGSLEYGAAHLKVPLIVVLGHRRCGAVSALVHAEEVHDHIVSLMAAIFPSVLATRGQPGDPVENVVRANVVRSVDMLRNSWPTLYALLESGKIQIVGAIYDLETGTVEWLERSK
ncbi:MAG: carbonic anhydrase [Bryobacterales bacterium]